MRIFAGLSKATVFFVIFLFLGLHANEKNFLIRWYQKAADQDHEKAKAAIKALTKDKNHIQKRGSSK